MKIITSTGEHRRLISTARAARWLAESQPREATVGGREIEWDREAAYEVQVEAAQSSIATALVGVRVEAGETDEDRDAGRIVHVIDEETVEVAWDSHVRTPADLSSLRAERSDR